MIGMLRRRRPVAQDAEELEPVEQRQAEVEQDEIGRIARDGGEGRRAGADDVGADFAAALERVLDEIGDIPFVLDDEHPLGPRAVRGRGRLDCCCVSHVCTVLLGTVAASVFRRIVRQVNSRLIGRVGRVGRVGQVGRSAPPRYSVFMYSSSARLDAAGSSVP